MTVTVEAPAKINLMLDILNRREDGYHNLWMVMQSIDIMDKITVKQQPGNQIVLTCSEQQLPTDESNIAYKAALAFFKSMDMEVQGIRIHIEKNIPFEAGLAGGSADGAAVLLALNEIFETHKTPRELCEIGLSIGADVPFCLLGGTMTAEETGGKLTRLSSMPECTIVLAKPDQGISTASAYAQFDSFTQECRHPDQSGMVDCLEKKDLKGIGRLVNNVFEQFIDVPDRVIIKTAMRRHNALGVCMSGSGPTIFGIFEKEADALTCAKELKTFLREVLVCRPKTEGCKLCSAE